ncbi:MAG: ferredoxin [Acidimicrobiales bacterium]|jgi:ferredoxin
MVPQGENGVSSIEIIDPEACMGSGNCLYWAPDVFDLDDAGVAIVTGGLPGNEEKVRIAAENCPTGAIRVEELYG